MGGDFCAMLEYINKEGNKLGNNDTSNKLYLLSNPFMCHLDMQEFFANDNNKVFEPYYWLMTESKQAGVIMAGSTGASASDAATSIAPMQGFFVQLKNGEAANPTVHYTAAMMTDPINGATLTRSTQGISQLYISATRQGISGTATVRLAYEGTDSNELLSMPTLLDSNWEQYPMVYTIGNDGEAKQIQTVKGVKTVPLGIYSNDASEVEVSFENVDAFESLALYDSETDTTTSIDEDTTLSLPGNTNGRYLLLFGSAIDEEEELLTDAITISSIERGTIWVTSDINDPITEIQIFDTNGRLCDHRAGLSTSSETIAIEGGIYIVKAVTANTLKTGKVIVRN